MADLQTMLGQAVAEAMEAEGFDRELGRLSASDRPDLADFQCNGALAAAQAAKRAGGSAFAPRDLAARLASRLIDQPGFASVEVAGPGFLNVRVDAAAIGARVGAIAQDRLAGAESVAAPRRVVIDFAGPNVAKPMHVGHLRASIIGEALKRLFRARGDQVWGDAHFGDWGFQMGLLLVAVADEQPSSPFLDPQARSYPADSPVTLDDLERLYPLAATRAKADPDYRDRARRATAELQSGRAGYRALWRHLVEVSRGALEREFAALGVAFDLWNGESDADAYIPAMLIDLRAKGLLVEDDGAQIVRVAREGDRRDLPPLLVVSSEGSSMYGTTDLATIVQRRAEIDPELILYCVDQRQSDHFEQVFRAAYLAGYAQPGGLEHAPNGTMNGTDGKPFKTRAGGVLKLHDLITQAADKARERLHEADLGGELDAEAFEATARMVGVAALKFADLSNFRGTSYVFDLDRFTSFEGRTGPYLLYQAVRIKSLLRRAEAQAIGCGEIVIEAVAERELALTLDGFAHATREAYDRRAPNLLADHAFRLAQAFSRFYAACPVLAAETGAQAASRLSIAAAALKQLEKALDWLGIEVPERM